MNKLLFLLLLSSITVCGQSSGEKIHAHIDNTKTLAHIRIPGTRLYIIPPPHFTVATSIVGLKKGEQAAMQIFDLVGGNFYTNAATFSKFEFLSRGAKVSDYQEITVNGYPAKYISLQGDPEAKGFSLVFGDTSFSTAIMCFYPSNDDATEREILQSLNTIYYDKTHKIDPFEAAAFSIDEKASKFKFLNSNPPLYLYTIGGVDDRNNPDASSVAVTQIPFDRAVGLKGVVGQMLDKAHQYGLTEATPKFATTKNLNGYEVYETGLDVTIKGVKGFMYYFVVAKDDKAFVVIGTIHKNVESTLQEVKKLAYSIKLK